jgi:uncharacterized UPF0160 family protein
MCVPINRETTARELTRPSPQAQFEKASLLTGQEFVGKLEYYANAWLPARDLLIDSVADSKATADPTGKIIVFKQFLPWKVNTPCPLLFESFLIGYVQEHLFELEADESVPDVQPNQAIYVVYPDETGGNWRIQAVPVSSESFESRKALPEAWRGLRDEEFSKASGIAGGIFIHASGFIGGMSPLFHMNHFTDFFYIGNKTKEGALKIAQAALAM